MPQVSVGQVENLEELVRGLLSMREALDSACRKQIAAAESQSEEARLEAADSEAMLEAASQIEVAAQQSVFDAQEHLRSAENELRRAESAFSACENRPPDKDGNGPDCSGEEAAIDDAQSEVVAAEAALEQAVSELEIAKANRQKMEQRVDLTRRALGMAECLRDQTQQECNTRFTTVSQSVDTACERLNAAQAALSAYLATHPPAAQFHTWLKWNPTHHGAPVTPDILRDRMNLSADQMAFFQQYLYDRNPAFRNMVDRYRGEWAAAHGDAERNIVARKTRIHLSGEKFGEELVRHALAPLGGRTETQGRTFVGDGGRYTKIDLVVSDLRVPVILGRGDGMGVPVGGSMAFEVKCGKAEYLYAQMEHMAFQAAGHQSANASCTICSRDIHDLPPEKERSLRDSQHSAGSPLVGMLPRKNEIDQTCLKFIQQPGD
jgi:hypothetical protein